MKHRDGNGNKFHFKGFQQYIIQRGTGMSPTNLEYGDIFIIMFSASPLQPEGIMRKNWTL